MLMRGGVYVAQRTAPLRLGACLASCDSVLIRRCFCYGQTLAWCRVRVGSALLWGLFFGDLGFVPVLFQLFRFSQKAVLVKSWFGYDSLSF
jgi:hypothetical protein